MDGTRLEILVDGSWERLKLKTGEVIKYNAVINRIGSLNTREISHTNTFSLPLVSENIRKLKLNYFNHRELAKSLNNKYEAKYYVEEKLLQQGYLVINNTTNDEVNVNFIDEGLSIIDKWGTTSIKDLLKDGSLDTPADYLAAIAEMRSYTLSVDQLATPLSQVGTRGYNLALFPNSLNLIGDKFNVDENGVRQNNIFNPYQSRPVFNAKAIFDLAAEAYGYTPIFDPSVNWNKVAKTYIAPENSDKNSNEEETSSIYSPISGDADAKLRSTVTSPTWSVESATTYPLVRSTKPNLVSGWVDPDTSYGTSYLDTNCIFIPDLSTLASGLITYRVQSPNEIFAGSAWSCWSSIVPGDVIFRPMVIQDEVSIGPGVINFSLSKLDLIDPPAGADELIGIFATTLEIEASADENQINNVQVTESFASQEAVTYDKFGQFVDENLDLVYSAPEDSIKETLSGLMQKEGILMNLNHKTKEILFFNYGRYKTLRGLGEFQDWSKYLQKYRPYGYNTEYGGEYASKNIIGLSDPYKGNTATIYLRNQDSVSKNKDRAENYVSFFKDVEEVNRIPNSRTPYYEYTVSSRGLVEHSRNLGELTQTRADNTTQGLLIGLPAISNVNYIDIPSGITEWYRLVDESVKASPMFLLPVDTVRNVDLSRPIYVEDLGGFYIIEEIAEYVDGSKEVAVKIIKIIDSPEFNNDFSNDFNI